MPNKLRRSLKYCDHDTILRSVENLIKAGLSRDEVADVLDELEEWLFPATRLAPDIWEGPEGWYKQFHTFVIEGHAGDTCPVRIWPRAGLRKWNGVDLDNPKTWKSRPKRLSPDDRFGGAGLRVAGPVAVCGGLSHHTELGISWVLE